MVCRTYRGLRPRFNRVGNAVPAPFAAELADEAATLALGARLGEMLRPGDFVCLRGGLGAGKTTLARGAVRRVAEEHEVPSPTFTLVQTYDAGGFELWHADLYRLEAPEEVHALGLLAVRDEVAALVEWPERLGPLLPPDALEVELMHEGDGRTAHLRAPEHTDWAARLKEAGFG